MFNHLRAKISLLRARRLLRLARKDFAKADKMVYRKENTNSLIMSPYGLNYFNSATKKNSKANELVWESRKLRAKMKKSKIIN